MEIYTFDKSLQERLVEFTEILSSRGDVVPASQIKSEWSFHVELVIEPTGWRALWKIPRLTCQDFEIHYPTIVVVEVQQVDFAELSALVKIVAVQDEIHLPEKCDVPLIELYPTKDQENQVLDMIGTSNCVDDLRFFFNYLWMPWDCDDDDNTDWVALHLETRIRLFFDMKRGVVDKETCDVIRTLVREGREIQSRITRLEADISDDDEDLRSPADEGKTCQLMKLHFRLQQIKTEMEVMENPAMREMLTRNGGAAASGNVETKRRESRGRKKEGYFVWHGGSLEEILESLNRAKAFLQKDIFLKVSGCLREALDASEVGDIVVIGEGEHHIRGAGGLEEGGTFRGIFNLEYTIICPKETESGPSLFDFSGGEILLENVCLDLGELQAGVLVRSGRVRIVGCKIIASNKSVVKLGVVVLSGGKLIAQNTVFSGLGTAVAIHPSGEATLEDCTFEDCVEGVQLQDDARFSATKCSLSGFKEYGIRMETQKYLSGTTGQTGSKELLADITEISIQDCAFENNCKGDVALRPRLASALASKQDGATGIMVS